MKVAFDTSLLDSGSAFRGIGVHTRELMKAFKHMDTGNIEIDFVDFTKVDVGAYDLAHYQFFHPHFLTLPRVKKTKTVVTVHDLIRLIYPKAYPAGVRGKLKFFEQKRRLRRADAIITISETSKKDIIRLLGISADKIFVTYLAPQSKTEDKVSSAKLATIKEKYSLPDKFVLYVGDVNYNKNLLILARAVKKINAKLVMVGKQAVKNKVAPNIENNSWREFLKKYGKDPDIMRLGYLEDREFDGIYMLASVYCQPSLYEGFGLPLLEAMERGCPVIASRIQAHFEIAEGAALFADPKDVADWADKIKKVIGDSELGGKLINKGYELVKNYSWEATAKATLEVYKKV